MLACCNQALRSYQLLILLLYAVFVACLYKGVGGAPAGPAMAGPLLTTRHMHMLRERFLHALRKLGVKEKGYFIS